MNPSNLAAIKLTAKPNNFDDAKNVIPPFLSASSFTYTISIAMYYRNNESQSFCLRSPVVIVVIDDHLQDFCPLDSFVFRT